MPVTVTHDGQSDNGTRFAETIPAPVAIDLDRLFAGSAGGLVIYDPTELFRQRAAV